MAGSPNLLIVPCTAGKLRAAAIILWQKHPTVQGPACFAVLGLELSACVVIWRIESMWKWKP
jgi:hypothetical protein